MWSLQHQLAHGGIPGLDPVEAPPRSASRTGAKQPSPFVDTDPIEIDESKPIFAKSAKDSPFGQRAVPADILAQCPPELRSLLEVHLLQGGAGQSTIDRFQEWAAEEDGEHARAFLAAAAAGQARLSQKVVPPPATATAPKPAGEVEARTPSQIRNSARATLNGARAEAQRQEKALEVSLRAVEQSDAQMQKLFDELEKKKAEQEQRRKDHATQLQTTKLARKAEQEASLHYDLVLVDFPEETVEAMDVDITEAPKQQPKMGIPSFNAIYDIAASASKGVDPEELTKIVAALCGTYGAPSKPSSRFAKQAVPLVGECQPAASPPVVSAFLTQIPAQPIFPSSLSGAGGHEDGLDDAEGTTEEDAVLNWYNQEAMAEQAAIEQDEVQKDTFWLQQSAQDLRAQQPAPQVQLAPEGIEAAQQLSAAAGEPPEHLLDTDEADDWPVLMEVQKVQGDTNAAGKRHAEEAVGEGLSLEQAASAGNTRAAKARAAPKPSKPAGEMAIEIAKLRQKEANLTEAIIKPGDGLPTAASSSSSSSTAPPPTSAASDTSKQQLG